MKSVVLCGSRRFKKEIRAFGSQLEKAGVMVFQPHLHERDEEWDILSEGRKNFVHLGLTHDHFYKIRMADVVFIYNKGGYAGVSTSMEIGYAVALNKPLYCLEKDEEASRQTLIREIVPTAKQLIKKLQ